MPVIIFRGHPCAKPVQKRIPTPKRMSELRYWYNAAVKALGSSEIHMPVWSERLKADAEVTLHYIVFRDLSQQEHSWTLVIHRKREVFL